MYSQGAIYFKRKNMCWHMILIKKPFVTNLYVFIIISSWILCSTKLSWKRKNKQLPWLPTPLVLLNYGSTVVTFNLWKYPLIRLAFAEITFRVDFFSQFWILTFFPRVYFCSSWNSRKFAWIYLRGCQNIYSRYKRKRMKELQNYSSCNESI